MIITLGVLGLSFRISDSSGQLALDRGDLSDGLRRFICNQPGTDLPALDHRDLSTKIRGLAEGTAAAFNWASNLIVSLTFLTLVEELGASSTFFLYAVASVLSWFFAYYFVPETKGSTLEQIEAFWRAWNRVHRTAV
jgi:Sugar (and other) transporter